MTRTVHGVPEVWYLRGRVHLATLGTTEPGDVFYLACDPETVWKKTADGTLGEYEFAYIACDTWFSYHAVGTGELGQRVVVVHNTRIPPEPGNQC